MCELGHILEETIGNHSFINSFKEWAGYIYCWWVLGIKATQILIYRDNFDSVNYLIRTHWFELKFLAVGTSVLIGVWLSTQSTKVHRITQITDRLSKSSSYSPWKLLRLSSNTVVFPSCFDWSHCKTCSCRVSTIFPTETILGGEISTSHRFSCCSANTSHSLTGQVLVLFGAPPPCL